MRRIIYLLGLIFVAQVLSAQNNGVLRSICTLQPHIKKISKKTNVIKGVLDNGLTYYLYSDPNKKEVASYYLLQKAGAILENDDQNGLAHFLEHMCFRGTENFPGQSIKELFEKKGLSHAINAYTGLESTNYYLKDIPTSDVALNDASLVILKEWCNHLLLQDDRIDSERPVIVEELRMRRNLAMRLAEQTAPARYNNSQYSKRFVTGTPENIKTFKKQSLVDFYKTWYRTDMQSIIVIGDIDVITVEQKIKNLFSSIPAVKNPTLPTVYDIPDNTETLFVQAKDPEVKNGSVSIKYRHKRKTYHSYVDKAKDDFTFNMLNFMLQKRVNQFVANNTESLFNAQIIYGNLVKNYKEYSITVYPKIDQAENALKSIMAVHNDILKNGFTEEEFIEARDLYEKSLKALKRTQFFSAENLLKKIQDNFIDNNDILDHSERYKIFKSLNKTLTTEDFKVLVNKLYSGPNKSIVVICNNRDKKHLSKAEVLNVEKNTEAKKFIFEKKEEIEIKEIENIVSLDNLKSGSITEVEKISNLDAEMWTLSNGAKVVYKSCKNPAGAINVLVSSPGGASMLSGDDIINAQFFSSYAPAMYIEGYNFEDYSNLINGKGIQYSLTIKDREESLSIASKYSERLTMFQLIHLLFEKPKFDEAKFDQIKYGIVDHLSNEKKTFSKSLKDTLSYITTTDGRSFAFDAKNADKVNIETIEKIYKNRFSNANDFVFYIVGSIGKSEAKKLATKYIGSISSDNKKETANTFDIKYSTRYEQKIIQLDMVDEKAGNVIYYTKEKETSVKDRIAYQIIERFMQSKLYKILRVKENGTYSVNVLNYNIKNETDVTKFAVSYECDPAKVEKLNELYHEAIKDILSIGMTQEELDLLRKKMNGQRGPIKHNGYYITMLKSYIETGVDQSVPGFIDSQFKAITLKEVNDMMRRYFFEAGVLDVIYRPK